MEFRILGPFELIADERALSIGGGRQRALLALLVLHANEIVSSERLIEEIWWGSSLAGGRNILHATASRVRKTLGPHARRLVTYPSGYGLHVQPGELDADTFERSLDSGRAKLEKGHAEMAARELRAALDLWRGPPLAEFAHMPFAQAEAARLEELWLQTHEDWVEAELQAGGGESLVPELERLCREYPFRERFPAQLMLILYRSGRQADALAVYSRTRETLREELGLDPCFELRELQRAILSHDGSLSIPAPASEQNGSRPGAGHHRKTVTVVFSEFSYSLASGERPDPEALGRIRARFVDAATVVLGRHGGMVQAPVGERLMAVFGVPTVHEDDALRAARASHELRVRISKLAHEVAASHHLNFEFGIGLETGEVIAEDRDDRATVTGEPVVVAERLAQAARGEVIVGAGAWASVGELIKLEPAPRPGDGGYGGPIARWRLVDSVPVDTPSRKNLVDTLFIGRRDELATLFRALIRAKHRSKAHTVNVWGHAGVGKSRLLQEFASRVSSDTTILTGRCLPYGESIAYWPLREMIRMAGADEQVSIARILEKAAGAERANEVISSLLGLGSETPAITREEAFWSVRLLLEQLARRRPLVAVFEDVHWAEPSFFDLITYLTERPVDAPLLIVCLARPEAMDGRASRRGQEVETIELDPLADEEAEQLLANLGWGSNAMGEAGIRITKMAGGNPLFLEQLAAWAERSPGQAEEPPIPPTIQALLAARLDLIGPEDRTVLDRAAVVGTEFTLTALEAQLPDHTRSSVRSNLESLVRQRILRPVQSSEPMTDAFRFRHALIRDVVYWAISKALRAEIHETYADWLASNEGLRPGESDELLGHHLEQAARCRAEISPSDPHSRELGYRAGIRLSAAGRRAMTHGDVPGATSLLERAAALLPRQDAARVALLPDLGEALAEAGRLGEGRTILSEAIEIAKEVDDPAVYWRALCADGWWRLRVDRAPRDDLEQLAQDAIRGLQEADTDAGLAHAWRLLAEVRHSRGQYEQAGVALERAFEHAQRAGSRHEGFASLSVLGVALIHGPVPVPEAISTLSRIRRRIAGDPPLEAAVFRPLGGLRALQGRVDEGRRLIDRARTIFEEFGWRWALASIPFVSALVEDRAGDLARAQTELRRGAELFGQMGERGAQATMLGGLGLAETLYQLGRHDEAEECAERSLSLTPPDYMEDLALSNAVRAKVLAHRGRFEEAERLVRRTEEFARSTDSFIIRTGTVLAVSEVLQLSGRAHEAIPWARKALRLYEDKGDVISTRRICKRLAELDRAGAGTTARS